MVKKIKGDLILKEDMKFKESIKIEGSIKSEDIKRNLIVIGDIDAWNIDALNIDAQDIDALNIVAWDIDALNIDARDIIYCETIKLNKKSKGKIKAKILIKERSKLNVKEW